MFQTPWLGLLSHGFSVDALRRRALAPQLVVAHTRPAPRLHSWVCLCFWLNKPKPHPYLPCDRLLIFDEQGLHLRMIEKDFRARRDDPVYAEIIAALALPLS